MGPLHRFGLKYAGRCTGSAGGKRDELWPPHLPSHPVTRQRRLSQWAKREDRR